VLEDFAGKVVVPATSFRAVIPASEPGRNDVGLLQSLC
jgi:hypothetical protein